jgi:hypothetical protein
MLPSASELLAVVSRSSRLRRDDPTAQRPSNLLPHLPALVLSRAATILVPSIPILLLSGRRQRSRHGDHRIKNRVSRLSATRLDVSLRSSPAERLLLKSRPETYQPPHAGRRGAKCCGRKSGTGPLFVRPSESFTSVADNSKSQIRAKARLRTKRLHFGQTSRGGDNNERNRAFAPYSTQNRNSSLGDYRRRMLPRELQFVHVPACIVGK